MDEVSRKKQHGLAAIPPMPTNASATCSESMAFRHISFSTEMGLIRARTTGYGSDTQGWLEREIQKTLKAPR